MHRLLTRESFREQVFSRDNGKCVICGEKAVDAHHIIDRALWEDGGYYIQNGVSLCANHHWQAEKTLLSCDELRRKAGIDTVLLPDHFYDGEKYDKWGNIVLPKGAGRIKGEMFGNDSVQKLLQEAGVLEQFRPWVKYPRTYHVPWSPNLQNDDRMHENVNFFLGKTIVATIKLDGENTTMYNDYIHARSLDSNHHESRSWVKSLWGKIAHEIPKEWRICGENVYAKHSIPYRHLNSYFYVFSIWDENNQCLSWEETKQYSEMLGLQTVPEMCTFQVSSLEKFKGMLNTWWQVTKKQSPDPVEGYVVRNIDSFPYKNFRRETAKYVREGHVQTDKFWMTQPVIPNKLREQ